METLPTDLAFVTDPRLAAVLQEYYRQAQVAWDAGGYLGTIVACGAVVEGLLTWALSRRSEDAMRSSKACRDRQGEIRPLPEWSLSNLIDVAFELQLIGRTAKQASWALKDFRNFIHPYNVLGQSARPDQALAMSAMAALAEICRSLQGHIEE